MAPVFPSKRIPPAHDATAKLRAAIVGGVFGPNERLVEEHLAEKFRTTRPAIRTALALLEQERLVVHERNRGARVRAVTPEEAEEILEARAALEALVARKAAENVDRAGIARLTAIVREMQEHQRNGNLRAYSDCNARFHQAIAEIAQHGTATRLLSLLKSQSVRYQYRSVLNPGRPARSLREHQAILRAFVKRDPAAAETAMRTHIEHIRAAIRESATTLLP